MVRFLRWLDKNLEETLMVILLFYITIVAGIQVTMRYVVGNSLPWTEESIRYFFVWMVFIGFSLGVKHDRHISITVFLDALPNKAKKLFRLLVYLIFLAFSILGMVGGLQVVFSFFEFAQLSPVLEIPMYYVYSAAPFGFALTSFRLVQKIIELLKAPPNDETFIGMGGGQI